MRIAVIGSGISGNLIARLLHTRHDVRLFEAGDDPGGHSQTVDVTLDQQTYSVDIGFMVFNRRTYPGFCEMLEQLGVASQDSDMSFSVHCEPTGCEYQGSSLNGLFAQRSNLFRPAFHRLLRDVVRFNRLAVRAVEEETLDEAWTVGELLDRWQMSSQFRRWYLVPMAAAIWSSIPNRIYEFPAKFLLGFFRNHGLLQLRDRPQWKTITGGSRQYVKELIEPLADRLQLATPVQRVMRTDDHVVVEFSEDRAEVFDEVVFATHADQTLQLLADATSLERELLSAFPYQTNHAVLHTDLSLLPQRPAAWASWNYYVPDSFDEPASVTYDLSRLQGVHSPQPILLTLNRTTPVREEHVLGRYQFEHPEFSLSAAAAQRRHAEISGHRRTHFCGAYWRYGFHEDGVQSALAVARAFDLGLADLRSDTAASLVG